MDQDEEGSNATVTYLTQSKNNITNKILSSKMILAFVEYQITSSHFLWTIFSDKKVIEVDPNAVLPEFLYDIQQINTQQQNDERTEVDSTESEEETVIPDTEKERKSSTSHFIPTTTVYPGKLSMITISLSTSRPSFKGLLLIFWQNKL